MVNANINPREVAQFDALAHRWWDADGELRTLHDINPARLAYISSHAQLAGTTVLDVGCGGGLLAEGLAQRGARVTALDASAGAIEAARLHLYESGATIDYQVQTVEAFAASNPRARFEVITCMEMLEHVPDPAQVIASCASLLAPGGKLFLSTLNRTPQSFAFAIVGAEYLLALLPRGTHTYAQFIRPAELAAWLRAAGLEVSELRGLAYNPFTRQAQLSHDMNINYLVYTQQPHG